VVAASSLTSGTIRYNMGQYRPRGSVDNESGNDGSQTAVKQTISSMTRCIVYQASKVLFVLTRLPSRRTNLMDSE